MPEYSYQTQEASVRDALREHILSAWGAQKIYDDPQEIPDGAGSLPLAVVMLMDTTPDEEESSLNHEAVRLEYQIHLREAKPNSLTAGYAGRSLHAYKMDRLAALRRLLFADRRLFTSTGNWNHEWLGDSIIPRDNGEQEREARNNWFSVSMSYAVTVRFLAYQ